jgi:hypothetical protein
MYVSKCKNIKSYLLHLLHLRLLKSQVKADAAMDERNQAVQHKLGHPWLATIPRLCANRES